MLKFPVCSLKKIPALLCFLLLVPCVQSALALEKVTVQLKWLHHYQFVGYYAALEKGFYQENGLDVTIVEGGPSVEVEQEVSSGRADFGVGTSALLLHRAQGADLVVLGQIFQHSPAILLTPRRTGIRSLSDMAGRRFMYSNQHGDMLTLLRKNGIDEKGIVQVPHQGDPRDLITGKAEVMIAYSFNEPFILEQAGEPYLTFSPLSYGIDFYGDNFFTTRELVESRPELAQAFREATLRGWRYALANKSEMADLIMARYSRQKHRDRLMFEANQMDTLIQSNLIELGYQSPSRWQHISQTFVELGMLPEGFDPSGVIYNPKPRAYRLLFGTIFISCAIIAILTAVVLTFRRLNRNLRAEIAERQHAEQAFRESEARLRIIFETSQAGIIMVDPQGTISFANQRMAEMFGCSLEQVTGSSYPDHLHREENPAGNALMRQLISGEIDFVHTERHYLRSDGSSFWGYLSGRRLEAPDGRFRALVGIIADISDRKVAEEASRKALVFIETLLAQSPMGICVFDGETGDCVRANQAAADMAGATIDALQQHNFRKLDSWRDANLTTQAEAVLADGQARPVETELQIAAGKSITGRFFLSRFIVEGKSHLLFIGQDATEEKRLDHENKRIEAQMLNMQKLESLGVLAGGIAHDFNNILTGVMGYISFAKMVVEPAHHAYGPLLKAEKASQRAAELASQLLTFAKGGQPIKKAFSVKTLVGESISLVLRGTNIKGIVQIPDTIIEADEGQINQAFNNIVINAVHAMPGGGTLTIQGESSSIDGSNRLGLQPGEYVKLIFTDVGCGISEADQKKVFDPYFTTKPCGTGLGLASTHSIINKHGGIIQVNPSVGKGTSFTIYLPSTVKRSMETNMDRELSVPRKRCGSVLVMDDEVMIRDLASEMLLELGYQVQTCVNGKEAIELYQAAKASGTAFSAVIMDLTVPGAMGGKQAAEHIIEMDPGARLIVSSGYSNDPVIAQYTEVGFCARLLKPYSVTDLAQVLNESLPATQAEPPAPHPFP